MAELIVQVISYVWIWLMQNLLVVNIFFSIIIVFFQRRDPKSVWTWLLVLYFIPILGFILYLIIGQDMHKSRMFKIKEIEDELNSAIQKQEDRIVKNRFEMGDEKLKDYADLLLYNLENEGAVYTNDNDVALYTDGNEKFDALINAMENAKRYIHIQYYIIRNDELFQRIEKVLKQKAQEKVEIRILYDSMGCREMKKKDWCRLRSYGIRTAEFFPAPLKGFHLRINYRNHRKIVIVDGEKGFVGGFNVGREYLGLDKKFGYWRDTHLKIEGSAVLALHMRFMLDWNYAAKENLFMDGKYYQQDDRKPAGQTGVQIITSGPDSKRQNIRNNYLRIINKAKKSIYIQTPYFIPDESILEALSIAAESGVDVKIMIPCKPDHPFVYWATYSYIGDMLSAGAKCYTYDNGFLHAKGVMSDGIVSCYGTANMDIRSFKLNFEVNATIYDEQTTSRLESIFMNDLKQCTKLTPYIYGNRSLIIRIKEQISRLLSPLM